MWKRESDYENKLKKKTKNNDAYGVKINGIVSWK